jgi:membrane protease YdiL (CAAX protease family)
LLTPGDAQTAPLTLRLRGCVGGPDDTQRGGIRRVGGPPDVVQQPLRPRPDTRAVTTATATAGPQPTDAALLPSRKLLVIELVIVLALSLGRSGIYALVRLIGAATAPGGLSAQTTTMHGSYAPSQPWLDLTLQLLGIVFAVMPVALAGYLLVRSGTSLRNVWFRGTGIGDLGRGAAVAAAVGSVGVAFYLVMHALGLNLTVVADGLPPVWWKFPVLVLSALENAVLEEFIVLGYVLVRLRQLGFGDPAAIGLSALLRGSYHLYQGIGGFVGNVAMGLLFGWLYRRWGRVTPLVVAHTLLDVGAFVGYAVLVDHVSWLP